MAVSQFGIQKSNTSTNLGQSIQTGKEAQELDQLSGLGLNVAGLVTSTLKAKNKEEQKKLDLMESQQQDRNDITDSLKAKMLNTQLDESLRDSKPTDKVIAYDSEMKNIMEQVNKKEISEKTYKTRAEHLAKVYDKSFNEVREENNTNAYNLTSNLPKEEAFVLDIKRNSKSLNADKSSLRDGKMTSILKGDIDEIKEINTLEELENLQKIHKNEKLPLQTPLFYGNQSKGTKEQIQLNKNEYNRAISEKKKEIQYKLDSGIAFSVGNPDSYKTGYIVSPEQTNSLYNQRFHDKPVEKNNKKNDYKKNFNDYEETRNEMAGFNSTNKIDFNLQAMSKDNIVLDKAIKQEFTKQIITGFESNDMYNVVESVRSNPHLAGDAGKQLFSEISGSNDNNLMHQRMTQIDLIQVQKNGSQTMVELFGPKQSQQLITMSILSRSFGGDYIKAREVAFKSDITTTAKISQDNLEEMDSFRDELGNHYDEFKTTIFTMYNTGRITDENLEEAIKKYSEFWSGLTDTPNNVEYDKQFGEMDLTFIDKEGNQGQSSFERIDKVIEDKVNEYDNGTENIYVQPLPTGDIVLFDKISGTMLGSISKKEIIKEAKGIDIKEALEDSNSVSSMVSKKVDISIGKTLNFVEQADEIWKGFSVERKATKKIGEVFVTLGNSISQLWNKPLTSKQQLDVIRGRVKEEKKKFSTSNQVPDKVLYEKIITQDYINQREEYKEYKMFNPMEIKDENGKFLQFKSKSDGVKAGYMKFKQDYKDINTLEEVVEELSDGKKKTDDKIRQVLEKGLKLSSDGELTTEQKKGIFTLKLQLNNKYNSRFYTTKDILKGISL